MVEDRLWLGVARGTVLGHCHTWGRRLSEPLSLCLSQHTGDSCSLNAVSLFSGSCFPPRICPQSACVRSIASLLREDNFGEAFVLFPLAHPQGLASAGG